MGVECWGWLICDGKPYRKHIPADFSQEYEWLTVDPDTELELYDAWMAGDMNTLSEILSPLITDQVISTWPHCPQAPTITPTRSLTCTSRPTLPDY